jgi:hypothetical protein
MMVYPFLPFYFFLLCLYLAQRVKKLHDLTQKIGEARIESYPSTRRGRVAEIL